MTHIARSLASLLVSILILAGCAGPEPRCPACAECAACPVPPRAPEAKLQQVPFGAIPGWADAALAPGLRAFAAGCARLAESSPLRRACEAARALPPGDEAAARAYVESTFEAWSIVAADGAA